MVNRRRSCSACVGTCSRPAAEARVAGYVRQVASDERAIENLLYTYAERIDGGDLDGVADLFAHGRITTSDGSATFEGRDEVLGMYTAAVVIYPDTANPKTKHVTTNAIIDVEPDGTASARSNYTVLQAIDELSLQPSVTGRCHDTFHRIEATWWFDTRVIFIDQTGNLSRHMHSPIA
jgi:3-phenylpropionate/cinnamic acid dioxygenase small subunit